MANWFNIAGLKAQLISVFGAGFADTTSSPAVAQANAAEGIAQAIDDNVTFADTCELLEDCDEYVTLRDVTVPALETRLDTAEDDIDYLGGEVVAHETRLDVLEANPFRYPRKRFTSGAEWIDVLDPYSHLRVNQGNNAATHDTPKFIFFELEEELTVQDISVIVTTPVVGSYLYAAIWDVFAADYADQVLFDLGAADTGATGNPSFTGGVGFPLVLPKHTPLGISYYCTSPTVAFRCYTAATARNLVGNDPGNYVLYWGGTNANLTPASGWTSFNVTGKTRMSSGSTTIPLTFFIL